MKDMFRLDGKIAVVLGGAGGIGQACAEAMASRGAKVVVAGRTFSKVQEVAGRITSDMGGEATPLSVDVTLEESVARLRDQVVEKYKTIDILINAHGINLKSPALELTVEGWDSIFATNTRGTMLSCKAFGEIMVEKRKGKIINLSSVRGIRGTGGGNTAYGATKGAVDMITRMLAAEWAPHNVNVNALAPSVIMTDIVKKHVAPERLEMLLTQVPLKRFCTLDDVTGACVYLASAESDFVTGQIFYIDGGITAVG
jgi:NAD(P)-dependent dehydrogenase (short-subunit alcohol dehydrogenase family)